MIKEEITAGLRQAIERGYSLEQAKQSFINAGYNSKDIEDSASSLGGLLTSIPEIAFPQKQQEEKQTSSIQTQQISQTNIQTQQLPQFPKPKKSKLKIFIIILIVILLILVAGFISSLLFKDKIIEFLKNIF